MSSTVQLLAESALRIARLISRSSATPSQRKSGWSSGFVDTTTAAGSAGGAVGFLLDLPQETSSRSTMSTARLAFMPEASQTTLGEDAIHHGIRAAVRSHRLAHRAQISLEEWRFP